MGLFKKLSDRFKKISRQNYQKALMSMGVYPATICMYRELAMSYLLSRKDCPDCNNGKNIPEKTLCPTCYRFWNGGVCFTPISFPGDFFENNKELIDALGLQDRSEIERLAAIHPHKSIKEIKNV
jgi:hypothetical protein